MKKWRTILAGVLALQLVVAIAVYWVEDDYDAFQVNEKLLTHDLDAVNRLQFGDGAQRVILEKQADQWVLPGLWQYPVNDNVLSQLLDTLSTLEKGWPVATTPNAAERFKVAENDYDREILFLTDDQLQAKLYIGTSPGFRKSHVRVDGEDSVFSVALESWKVGVKPDDWLKKDILALGVADIDQLVMADFVLTSSERMLQLDDLSEDEYLDTAALNNLVNNLSGLQIQSVLGTEKGMADYQSDHATLEINLMLKSGDELNYKFFKPDSSEEEGSHHVLKRSDLPYYFAVAEFTVKPLLEVKRGSLVQESDDETQQISEQDD